MPLDRSPPDKNVNRQLLTNVTNQQFEPFAHDLNRETSVSLNQLIDDNNALYFSPIGTPSMVNTRKRQRLRQFNTSSEDPTNNSVHELDSAMLKEIVSCVRSTEDKIERFSYDVAKLVKENDELKRVITEMGNYFVCMKNEITDLKNLNNELLIEIKYVNSSNYQNFPLLSTKSNIITNATPQTASISNNLQSFADTLKNALPSNPVLIVKPKNVEQNSTTTMNAVKSKITPTKLNVKNVKHIAKGGIAIECGSKEAVESICNNAKDVLGESYTVSIPEKRKPRVKVIGLSEKKSSEIIESELRSQNDEIFTEASKISVSECFEVRSSKYGIRIEVDPGTFGRLMMNERMKLRIGWDLCSVYEIFSTIRCYKCWRFHHTSKEWKSMEPICGKCSGNHVASVCESDVQLCINCSEMKSNLRLDIDCAHPSWSTNCTVYKRKTDLERKNINYVSDT